MLSHPALMLKLSTTVSCQLCAQVLEERLSQWLTEWKIQNPAVQWKKTPCKQGTTAFVFVCCSRLQKVYFKPGLGYKIKESAAKKELNPMISLLSHLPGSTINESIWEGKKLNKQPCTSECGSCILLFQGVISKAWVSSHCSAHNCFYPLENNLVRSRIKLICEQCLPFFLTTKQTTN